MKDYSVMCTELNITNEDLANEPNKERLEMYKEAINFIIDEIKANKNINSVATTGNIDYTEIKKEKKIRCYRHLIVVANFRMKQLNTRENEKQRSRKYKYDNDVLFATTIRKYMSKAEQDQIWREVKKINI